MARRSAPFLDHTILPIPLRADLTIYVQGLPVDLTAREARKIGAVILALSVDAARTPLNADLGPGRD